MRRLAIALLFLGGCAVGGAAAQLAVPNARASKAQRWDHFCMVVDGNDPGELTRAMQKPEEDGFELVTAYATALQVTMACFKRPAEGGG